MGDRSVELSLQPSFSHLIISLRDHSFPARESTSFLPWLQVVHWVAMPPSPSSPLMATEGASRPFATPDYTAVNIFALISLHACVDISEGQTPRSRGAGSKGKYV